MAFRLIKPRFLFSLSVLLALAVTAVACGSDEPAAVPVDVAAIVQQTLAAQQPGITSADVASEITKALSAQPGVTSADVATEIAKALSAQPGVTSADVATEIAKALTAQQPGITSAEVAKAIETALANQPGLTEADVAKAVADATASQKPGLTAGDVEAIVNLVVQAVPEAAAPAPAGSKPSGELTVGVGGLPPLVQLGSKDAAGTTSVGMNWSIYEGLFKAPPAPQPGEASSPAPATYVSELAESWTIAPDQTSISFNIRQGVQFHDGWGELTAEDVAWTFNESLILGSTGNGAEQLPPALKVGWDAPDKYTAVMNIEPGEFPPTWGTLIGKGWSDTYGMLSKNLYDTVGEDEFLTTPIGTGPYNATYWKGHDEMVAEAVVDHWRVTPSVKVLRVIEMPEQATREAALRTREIDIAPIPGKALKALLGDIGGGAVVVGLTNPNTIYMSGNYWGKTCPSCEETDVYRKWDGFTEAIELGYPWVGDPEDAEGMEKARKVRWAMSMAIDRQTIIDTVLGGFGAPVYNSHMHSQFPPGSPLYRDEWTVPFDTVKANEWLTEAGYPDGFKVTLWSAPDFSFWDPEIADAVGEMWRQNLGLDVTVDHSPYASRRPQSVDKSMNVPWLHGFGFEKGGTIANFYCPHPGHIGGLTLPDDLCDIGFENDVEPSFDKRMQNNATVGDYLSYWQLHIGVATVGNYFVYQPYVKGWKPFTVNYFNNPESITIER